MRHRKRRIHHAFAEIRDVICEVLADAHPNGLCTSTLQEKLGMSASRGAPTFDDFKSLLVIFEQLRILGRVIS